MIVQPTAMLRVAVTALALLALACPRKQTPDAAATIAIGELEVRDRTPAADRVATDVALVAHVRDQLKKHALRMATQGETANVYDLRLELGLRVVEDRGAALVSLTARPRGGGFPLRADLAEQVAGKSATGEQRRAQLFGALDRAVAELAFQARLATAPPAAIAGALRRERDPRRVAAAIELAAVRRIREAVPEIIARLDDQRAELADRAIGALVEINDRRAVKPLARLTKFADTARLAKVIDAIGTLGGAEAVSYLEFVAQGHEDADIRNLAREALERIRRARPEDPTTRHK